MEQNQNSESKKSSLGMKIFIRACYIITQLGIWYCLDGFNNPLRLFISSPMLFLWIILRIGNIPQEVEYGEEDW